MPVFNVLNVPGVYEYSSMVLCWASIYRHYILHIDVLVPINRHHYMCTYLSMVGCKIRYRTQPTGYISIDNIGRAPGVRMAFSGSAVAAVRE